MTTADDAPPYPRRLAVFPLSGALLPPRAQLPLNIFEPRYLAMFRDAMADRRLIGIVQPRADGERPPLFGVGGLGRITQFAETGDGRFLITLTGVVRFRVEREAAVDTPYRQVDVDYAPYVRDALDPDPLPATARAALEATLRSYLDDQGLAADWEAVSGADDEGLVNTLAAVCPFEPVERQALIEAVDLADRASTLTTLMTLARAGAESRLQ